MQDINFYNSLRRKELIAELIKWGIKDNNVLDAFYKVKRELFVPDEMKKYAYENKALPIESNQTISQPYTVAFMTELLGVKKGMKILEIGTGSGYQAAILSELGAIVYSIERIENLFNISKTILEKLNYNIKLKCGDGSLGWTEYSPYDGIIVTAAAPKVPQVLLDQLKINGVLVIPVGDKSVQQMHKVKKNIDNTGKEEFVKSVHSSFQFVPLIGKEAWNGK